MGLDVVEIILQTEETFGIAINDADAERIRSAGDLYREVLRQLGLPYLSPAGARVTHGVDRSRRSRSPGEVWPVEDIWPTVHAIVITQLQVRADDVFEGARFQEDLGAD